MTRLCCANGTPRAVPSATPSDVLQHGYDASELIGVLGHWRTASTRWAVMNASKLLRWNRTNLPTRTAVSRR